MQRYIVGITNQDECASEDVREIMDEIRGRGMGYLFENMEKMDIQAEKRNAQREKEHAEKSEREKRQIEKERQSTTKAFEDRTQELQKLQGIELENQRLRQLLEQLSKDK